MSHGQERAELLIERWLPVAEIGAESQRERAASSALPPLYFLHVWWARRPLVASRAAVLGSVLPAWRPDWPAELRERFPTEKEYREWVLAQLGIRGDPVAARRRVNAARERGERIPNPYEGPRAFTVAPSAEDLAWQRRLLRHAWSTDAVAAADPMAGGGSIPLEALRLGLHTRANELNPVAAVVLTTTLEYPARFGPDLADRVTRWGRVWADRVRTRLTPFFPAEDGETVLAYIFARTVACPETGKPVPLSPNWWLRRGADPVAVRVIADPHLDAPAFEIVAGPDARAADADTGTVARGHGRSCWTGTPIPSATIKAEAQAGRMGQLLYALATRRGSTRGFRAPNKADLAALAEAEAEVQRRWPTWEAAGLIPTDEIPEGSKTREPLAMGMTRWCDLFAPRQLLALVTCLEELRALEPEVRAEEGDERAVAVLTLLALALDKACDHNSRMSRWESTRAVIKGSFDRHDFSFKWSHAEMNLLVPAMGLDWCIDQVADAYRGITKLVEPSRGALFSDRPEAAAELIEVQRGNAAALGWPDRSLHAVVVDPPYYDNVQYGELSDYFYVWLRRAVGHLHPGLFAGPLVDKDDEAVANPARFERLDKRRAKALAHADYERKMTACFREARRCLRDDGVLTVMFTHKRVEAWDALGRALIEAGFVIESSWPIHTESEHSLHQRGKAAAASTILLGCRVRPGSTETAWWDDLADEVRREVRRRATDLAAAGVTGVDLYIAAFGPALSVVSARWPVLTSEVDPQSGEPRALRPEEALDLAREEVADLRRRGLLGGRTVDFDPVTDWYLLAWDAFGAAEIPFDEARKLGLALGVEVSDLTDRRVVTRKGDGVVIQEPRQRRRPGLADPDADTYPTLLDAAHALMVVVADDGVRGATRWLERTGLRTDARLRALLQALLNAIPRTRVGGDLARPEARALEALAVLFDDLRVPPDTDEPGEAVQQVLTVDDPG